MTITLTDPEIRVLGSLVEKEITTPEYYPLSLNSLINACNQKTNRDPVVSYSECTVTEALEALCEKGLVLLAGGRDSRVPKYDNYFADSFHLSPAETAAMCVLMLRGPQTPGEIRARAERLYEFAELSDVEEVLEGLAAREEGPLVMRLPRQPGRKEHRYAHLLSGAAAEDTAEADGNGLCGEIGRIQEIEGEIAALRQELRDLRDQFVSFKAEFE